jgi:hypothetical protein
MTRRKFAFWVGFGLFSLAEKLHAGGLDQLAAATMRATESKKSPPRTKSEGAVHWTPAENKKWRWYERENFIKGEWKLTGTTAPINKETGERTAKKGGYLDDSLLPAEMRHDGHAVEANPVVDDGDNPNPQLPTATRRKRHGRPPSKWLRSLHADELRIWLKTIEVPEAGVSGMTYREHLTRDHSFDEAKIEGLTDGEQAKLHAAAHFGY